VEPAELPAGAGGPARPPSLAFLLMAAGRKIRSEVEEQLREHGIALRHLSVLGHLRNRSGISGSELAPRAGVTVQSMQATIAGLEDLGAIERTGASRHCSSRSPSGASWKPSFPFSV